MAFLNNLLQPLLMALTLLTRLPVTRLVSADWSSSHYQNSAYYYPVVGLGIGAVLWLLSGCLPIAPAPFLAPAILLAVWVALSGALHLDGLADCADAYFAAHKNGPKALAVMQDPACGAMAVVAVFLVLSLKLAALATLAVDAAMALLLAPMLARTAALLLMNTTHYARADEGGMVAGLSQPSAGVLTWVVVVVSGLLVVLLLPPLAAGLCLTGVAVLTYYWRKVWLNVIKGFTGDCLGGLIELLETLVLVILALMACSV